MEDNGCPDSDPVSPKEESPQPNDQDKKEEKDASNGTNERKSQEKELETIPRYVLTNAIVDSLRCSLCKDYLSVPPVYVISEDGTRFKCGRCLPKSHVLIRATVYENLAKHMIFPCVFNCGNELVWNEVKSHEKECSLRKIKCVGSHCGKKILMCDFIEHYKEKHSKSFFDKELTIANIQSSYGLCVLECDGAYYVVSYDYDNSKFGVEVSSLSSTIDKKQYEIKLNSSGSSYSIIVTEQNITPFNDRIHCYSCLKGSCSTPSHLYSSYRKGYLKHMPTKIERDIVRKTFGSKTVSAVLKIIDFSPVPENTATADFEQIVIDEVNEENENNEAVNNVDLLEELTRCPICKTTMVPPIHQCKKGHVVCSDCKSRYEKCAACEEEVSITRNYVLEGLVASLKLSNSEDSSSSNEPPPPSPEKEITCPSPKCFDRIKISSISTHFRDKHTANFHYDRFKLHNVYAYYNVDILIKNGKCYVVLFDFDDVNFGISMCCLEANDNRHQYEVRLSSSDGKYCIAALAQKMVTFNEKEHCFKCSLGTCQDTEQHTYRRKRKEVFRRLTTKINRDSVRRMFAATSKLDYAINIVPAQSDSAPWKEKLLRSLFDCPSCGKYMEPPIYECRSGHSVCDGCRRKSSKCSTCDEAIEETRNLSLESVAEKIEAQCKIEESCGFRAGLKRVIEHERECRPVKKSKTDEIANTEIANN